MSVERQTNIGWIVFVNGDLNPYDCCEEMALEDPYWHDFLTETGNRFDGCHICLFNGTKDSNHYGADEEGFVHLKKYRPPLSNQAEKFLCLFQEKYGDNSIFVDYGIVTWYC